MPDGRRGTTSTTPGNAATSHTHAPPPSPCCLPIHSYFTYLEKGGDPVPSFEKDILPEDCPELQGQRHHDLLMKMKRRGGAALVVRLLALVKPPSPTEDYAINPLPV